ncbi:hypothetical protein [Sorangium sp. So ce131]|uniref:hypothetical protein n=1 Tax=Sorangium sp. So ce131 TaxID=3133282 RepID=UPI003F5E4589
MLWLWYVGPFAVLFVWYLTGLRTRHESRRDAELVRWRALMIPQREEHEPSGYRGRKTRKTTAEIAGPRPVRAMPPSFERALDATGGGAVIARYELVAKLAYVAIVGPSAKNGSEYQVVVTKLEKAAPQLTVCPLPILDGKPVPNSGVQFKKDPEFMDQFLVEGPDAKAIGRWLSRRVRGALREFPDAWLFVQDRVMAVAAYGPVDAERLEALVVTADEIFGEHGAGGAPSLLFEEDSDSGAEDEDDEDEDEDEEDDADERDADAEPTPAEQAAPGSARPAARRP